MLSFSSRLPAGNNSLGFLCVWCIYSVRGSGSAALLALTCLREETPSPSRAFVHGFHTAEAPALPTGPAQTRSLLWGSAGPSWDAGWDNPRHGDVGGTERARAKSAGWVARSFWETKKKETWNPAPNSVLSKRSGVGGSSCEVGDASWHWQGQGWHKSPPTAVTGAYFSKHITKEAKYTFSIQLPKAAIAQSLKINPFGLCLGQN